MTGLRKEPGRERIPWGLCGAVVLALLVESWVLRHALDLTPSGAMGLRFAARASRESTQHELICLGDSLVKHGIAPRVLEARLGKRTVNLACIGGTAPLTYFLLKRALDAGARPTALLVDFKATQLQSGPENLERALVEVLEPAESLDLAESARDPVMLARIAVAQLLPSVRARAEIRAWIVSAVRGRDGSIRQENRAVLRNWSVNRGAGLLDSNPNAELIAEHWDESYNTAPGPWYSHPINAVYLKRFLDLAAARDLPVYWLVPPIHPRIQKRRDQLGLDVGFNRMLHRASQRYPNLTIIDGRAAGYPARHFVDATHLDSQGANAYTDDLASLLTFAPNGHPERSRWLTLPLYRVRPTSVDLEDYRGSRLALEEAAKAPDTPSISRSGAIQDRDRVRR